MKGSVQRRCSGGVVLRCSGAQVLRCSCGPPTAAARRYSTGSRSSSRSTSCSRRLSALNCSYREASSAACDVGQERQKVVRVPLHAPARPGAAGPGATDQLGVGHGVPGRRGARLRHLGRQGPQHRQHVAVLGRRGWQGHVARRRRGLHGARQALRRVGRDHRGGRRGRQALLRGRGEGRGRGGERRPAGRCAGAGADAPSSGRPASSWRA